ncbi:MAG: 5'/3'-nucleotidase SurE, partial [Planctomycetota bacterium]
FYSGTVAAAVEAAFEGVPSVALSAVFDEHFDAEKAARCAFGILEQLLPLHPGDVININIPSLSEGDPKGVVVVPQSTGGLEETFRLQDNKQGQMIFEYTGGRHRNPAVSPADTTSLADGYITVTALHFDMTNYERNKSLSKIAWNLNSTD